MPAAAKFCTQCHAPIAAAAPEGLCRACLLKLGLEANTLASTDANLAAQWQAPRPEDLSAQFPELDLLGLIGRGGMGAVYKARQQSLDRLVALKILPPEVGAAADFKQRFAREAQAMARLNHPHIVTIYDFGQRDGLYYFVMEYMDGLSLRQLIDAGHTSSAEALAIVPQICDALQFAHDRGVVHRDIKPENILLNREGQVKIADFGLAKLVGLEAPAHAAEPIVGTPRYMAPEQIGRPADVDHRADIYSLGVVFYQLLTGELPDSNLQPPSRRVSIDVRLDEVVLRALERDPDRRYQQASEVKTEVETIVGSPRPAAEVMPTALRSPLKSSRGHFATPEYLATAAGGFWRAQGTGELSLFDDRLVFVAGANRIEIPYTALQMVDRAHVPRWSSPMGHEYLLLTYEQGAEQGTLLFMPDSTLFRTADATRQSAAEWMLAIRDTARAATGKILSATREEPLVVPVSPWGVLAVLGPMMLGNLLLLTLMHLMTRNQLTYLVWLFPGALLVGVTIWLVVSPVVCWLTARRTSSSPLRPNHNSFALGASGNSLTPNYFRRLVAGAALFSVFSLLFPWAFYWALAKPKPLLPPGTQPARIATKGPAWLGRPTFKDDAAHFRGVIGTGYQLVLRIECQPKPREWRSGLSGGVFHAIIEPSTSIPVYSGGDTFGFQFVVNHELASNTTYIALSEGNPVTGKLVMRRNSDVVKNENTCVFADIVQADGTKLPVSLRLDRD